MLKKSVKNWGKVQHKVHKKSVYSRKVKKIGKYDKYKKFKDENFSRINDLKNFYTVKSRK